MGEIFHGYSEYTANVSMRGWSLHKALCACDAVLRYRTPSGPEAVLYWEVKVYPVYWGVRIHPPDFFFFFDSKCLNCGRLSLVSPSITTPARRGIYHLEQRLLGFPRVSRACFKDRNIHARSRTLAPLLRETEQLRACSAASGRHSFKYRIQII